MPSKWTRRGLLLFAIIIGLILGLLRPAMTQGLLSLLGIVAGLGFFMLSRSTQNKKGKDKAKAENTFERWFILIQMVMYFIIGGALGSMIPYLISLRN